MSFASDQLKRVETLIAENTGVQSVTISGQAVTFADLLAQRDYWLNEVARENRKRPRAMTIELGGSE